MVLAFITFILPILFSLEVTSKEDIEAPQQSILVFQKELEQKLSETKLTDSYNQHDLIDKLNYLSFVAKSDFSQAQQFKENFTNMVKSTANFKINQIPMNDTIKNGTNSLRIAFNSNTNLMRFYLQANKTNNIKDILSPDYSDEGNKRLKKIKGLLMFWKNLLIDFEAVQQALPKAMQGINNATNAERLAYHQLTQLESIAKKLDGSGLQAYYDTLWVAFETFNYAQIAVNASLEAQQSINTLKNAYLSLSFDKDGIAQATFYFNQVKAKERVSHIYKEKVEIIIAKMNKEIMTLEMMEPQQSASETLVNENTQDLSQQEKIIKELEQKIRELTKRVYELTECQQSLSQQRTEQLENFQYLKEFLILLNETLNITEFKNSLQGYRQNRTNNNNQLNFELISYSIPHGVNQLIDRILFAEREQMIEQLEFIENRIREAKNQQFKLDKQYSEDLKEKQHKLEQCTIDNQQYQENNTNLKNYLQKVLNSILPQVNIQQSGNDEGNLILEIKSDQLYTSLTDEQSQKQKSIFKTHEEIYEHLIDKISFCSIDDKSVVPDQTIRIFGQNQNQEEIKNQVISEINDSVKFIESTLEQIRSMKSEISVLNNKDELLKDLIQREQAFNKIQMLLKIIDLSEQEENKYNYPSNQQELFDSSFEQNLQNLLQKLLESKEKLQLNNQGICIFQIFSEYLWNIYKSTYIL